MTRALLQADSVGKEYKLYASPRDRLLALLTGRQRHVSHWALRDVSFSLGRGQCLGVIGDNGAGKSSLLKLVAGTLQPTRGTFKRIGRVTAILELGAGFHPDFTGRENLAFGGSLIGITPAEMAALEASIIAFSELGGAIDRPVKTYSSGMVVRLAFALVTAIVPDVLIIDEALAVGDQHFQRKCIERIGAYRESGCTILFCSHSLYHVRQLCDTVLWLDKGATKALGDTDAVLAAYEAHVRVQDAAERTPARLSPTPEAAPLPGHLRAKIVSVTVAGLAPGDPPALLQPDLCITVHAQCLDNMGPSIGVMIEQHQGVGIASVATHADKVHPQRLADGSWRTTLTFTDLPLNSGDYVLSVYLFDPQGLTVYEEWLHCQLFRWVSPSLTPGLVKLPHHWSSA